jgi:hypothetical protein
VQNSVNEPTAKFLKTVRSVIKTKNNREIFNKMKRKVNEARKSRECGQEVRGESASIQKMVNFLNENGSRSFTDQHFSQYLNPSF